MNTEQIIAQIDEEISKLQQAKTLLLGNVGVKPRVGRPKKSDERAKGVISAEGKAKIAEAQRKRWAKIKKKTTVKTVAKAPKPVKKAAAKKAVKATPVKASTPTA